MAAADHYDRGLKQLRNHHPANRKKGLRKLTSLRYWSGPR